jgi:hypothetical protein
MICNFHHILLGRVIKRKRLHVCSTHNEREWKDHLGYLGVNERIILKPILNKYDVMMSAL